jgi:hypothetical protein
MRRAIALTAAVTVMICAPAVGAGRPSVVGHIYEPGGHLPHNTQDRRPHPAVDALVVASRLGSDGVSVRTRVRPNGSFDLTLAPGRYRIVASLTPPRFRHDKLCEVRHVTVERNRTAHLTMECYLF